MLLDERLLEVDNLVGTKVGVEVGLDGVENHDGTVGTTTSAIWVSIRRHKSHTVDTYPNAPVAASFGEKAIASWKVLKSW